MKIANDINSLLSIVHILDACVQALGDKLDGFDCGMIFAGMIHPRLCKYVETAEQAKKIALAIQPDTSRWKMEADSKKVFSTVVMGVEIAIRTQEAVATQSPAEFN